MARHFANADDARADARQDRAPQETRAQRASRAPQETQAATPVVPVADVDDDAPTPAPTPTTASTHTDLSFAATAQRLASSYDDQNLRRVRRKHRSGKRNVLIALGIALLAIALVAGAVAYWLGTLDRTMRMDPEESRALVEELAAPNNTAGNDATSDAYYVLIVGSDARKGVSGARGDVMILARLDPTAGTVHLVSIPRDTIIVSDGGWDMKINASFAYGGAAGAVRCVSQFAGVPITHYVEIGFDGMVAVIDALGGVWVDIPEAFTAQGQSFSSGQQLLNGERALIYARERHSFSGGDFTRSQSQRQIVKGVIDKVLQASPAEIPGIVQQLAGMVSTDYRVTDLVSLALAFRESGVTLYSCVCPSYTFWKDDVSYDGTMFAEWQELMRRVDAGLDPEGTDPIPEPQASDTTLGAAPNSGSPRDYQDLANSSPLTTDDVDAPSG